MPRCISHVPEVVVEADVQAFNKEGVHYEAAESNIAGIRIPQRGVTHHATQHLDGDVDVWHALK